MDNEKILQEILETVTFIKDNAAMKADMDTGFDSVHAELESIRNELSDIKQKLADLEKRTQEDGDAAVTDIVDLRQRVEKIERQLAQWQKLQPA